MDRKFRRVADSIDKSQDKDNEGFEVRQTESLQYCLSSCCQTIIEMECFQDLRGLKLLVASLRLFRGISKYLRLHEELLGEYEYGLPPKPSPETMLDLSCTFDQWLKRNGLELLRPFFVYVQVQLV